MFAARSLSLVQLDCSEAAWSVFQAKRRKILPGCDLLLKMMWGDRLPNHFDTFCRESERKRLKKRQTALPFTYTEYKRLTRIHCPRPTMTRREAQRVEKVSMNVFALCHRTAGGLLSIGSYWERLRAIWLRLPFISPSNRKVLRKFQLATLMLFLRQRTVKYKWPITTKRCALKN